MLVLSRKRSALRAAQLLAGYQMVASAIRAIAEEDGACDGCKLCGVAANQEHVVKLLQAEVEGIAPPEVYADVVANRIKPLSELAAAAGLECADVEVVPDSPTNDAVAELPEAQRVRVALEAWGDVIISLEEVAHYCQRMEAANLTGPVGRAPQESFGTQDEWEDVLPIVAAVRWQAESAAASLAGLWPFPGAAVDYGRDGCDLAELATMKPESAIATH